MAFISMFMAPVPNGNRDAYIEHSRKAAVVFRDLGALEVVETWGVDVPDGELTSMPMAVRLGEGESVVIGWVRWPSKEAADAAWAKMEEDPRMAELSEMPFDGMRMIFGGFETILEA